MNVQIGLRYMALPYMAIEVYLHMLDLGQILLLSTLLERDNIYIYIKQKRVIFQIKNSIARRVFMRKRKPKPEKPTTCHI